MDSRILVLCLLLLLGVIMESFHLPKGEEMFWGCFLALLAILDPRPRSDK